MAEPGSSFEIDAIDMITVADGKLTAKHTYLDWNAALAQLGSRMTTPRHEIRTAAEWVEGFAEGWRAPADADSFIDHFDPLLDDEIRLVQPQLPHGHRQAAFREEFARPLFELLCDIRGDGRLLGATNDDDVVFIELAIRARLAGGRR